MTTGIIIVNGIEYVFRTDTYCGQIWAWRLHDTEGVKATTHKWLKYPKESEIVSVFELDSPSRTVPFFPFE